VELRLILQEITAGPQRAERAFFSFDSAYRRKILKYLLRLRLSVDDAEDVTQAVYLKVFRNSERGLGYESPEAWLWTIVHNAALDLLRARGRVGKREMVFDDSISAEVENRLANESLTTHESIDGCVDEGVRRFASVMPERATVLLLQLDGLPISEIAKQIARTERATTQYLYESRKQLAPFVEHCRPALQ
jgi:RNA polymerase sigma-70 factor (ECF subfamily)